MGNRTLNAKNPEILAIGLMSGTSLDGVDAAIIQTDGHNVKRFGKAFHMPYTREQQDLLLAALAQAKEIGSPTKRSNSIVIAEGLINDLHYDAAMKVIEINELEKQDVAVVGFHGQTLLHNPDEGWSWQIGDGKELAHRLGICVVNDFRRFDVENGGQGAPLVPVFHRALLPDQKNNYPVALLNIGGVGNITWIGGDDESLMMGFDTGPGNALLDDWVRSHSDMPFDKDGLMSSKGAVQEIFVNELMSHDYFKEIPPKSLDRNSFDIGPVSKLSPEDGAATLIAFTVTAIKMAEVLCPDYVKKWYVCGGGAHNPTMMAMLSDTLYGDVENISSLGFDGDYVEAEAFGFLAVRKIYDLPITFPGTTGVRGPSTGGVLHKVSN
ncbi:MAG: anhydro-N-acetylmuramic acid kinase [Emcibacteraceae bacterium]|nr:anhydro-N-acetylmuramic acid kinase [Emcibacteraceae bacterium]MDG1996370.1 anhydro-N-acetylmuramic acid kinase [Emcibacteraceae bacterium]